MNIFVSGSPSDSNNSTNSSSSDGFTWFSNKDLYDIAQIASLLVKKEGCKISPYRRYIENVLKTRALKKSFNFLKNLHKNVLQKTKLTLDYWDDEGIVSKVECYLFHLVVLTKLSIFQIICNTEEEELRRFGVWSPEATVMDLPSYRTMFLFLALVPLEVVNEYLMMRLEQKPEKPSPLSIRQLMRELKEGLQVALHERELAYR